MMLHVHPLQRSYEFFVQLKVAYTYEYSIQLAECLIILYYKKKNSTKTKR